MKYIIVDPDEQNRLELQSILDSYQLMDYKGSYSIIEDDQAAILDYPPDIIFIREGQTAASAENLVSTLRRMNQQTIVLFVGTGETDTLDAFKCEADGFILIPFDNYKILQILLRSIYHSNSRSMLSAKGRLV
jgi:DNA-binding NarL/FixJ family response regulator